MKIFLYFLFVIYIFQICWNYFKADEQADDVVNMVAIFSPSEIRKKVKEQLKFQSYVSIIMVVVLLFLLILY